MEFEKMSLRELERRLANCLPGSVNHGLIVPVIEAKRRRADSRRIWIIFIVGTVVAVAGLVAKIGK
jgi:hypothetical protein